MKAISRPTVRNTKEWSWYMNGKISCKIEGPRKAYFSKIDWKYSETSQVFMKTHCTLGVSRSSMSMLLCLKGDIFCVCEKKQYYYQPKFCMNVKIIFGQFYLVLRLCSSGVTPLLLLCTFLVRVTTNTGIWCLIRAKFVHCCWAYPTNCN
jgi:hypothetical protein